MTGVQTCALPISEMQKAQFSQQSGMQQTGIEVDRAVQAAGFANAAQMQLAQFGQQMGMQQSQIQADSAAQQAGFQNAQLMQQTVLEAQQKLAAGQQLSDREIAAMQGANQLASAQISAGPGMQNAQTVADQAQYNQTLGLRDQTMKEWDWLNSGNPTNPSAGGQTIQSPGQVQGGDIRSEEHTSELQSR